MSIRTTKIGGGQASATNTMPASTSRFDYPLGAFRNTTLRTRSVSSISPGARATVGWNTGSVTEVEEGWERYLVYVEFRCEEGELFELENYGSYDKNGILYNSYTAYQPAILGRANEPVHFMQLYGMLQDVTGGFSSSFNFYNRGQTTATNVFIRFHFMEVLAV